MASKKTLNAWDDDDWETQADRALQEDVEGNSAQEPTTKAERLAKHREMQRKIWEAAYVLRMQIFTLHSHSCANSFDTSCANQTK